MLGEDDELLDVRRSLRAMLDAAGPPECLAGPVETPPALPDAPILRADRERAAQAMTDLALFGGAREARQVLLALEPLEDTRAAMVRKVEATSDPSRRWLLRAELLLAGAVLPETIERWGQEAAEAAHEADSETVSAEPAGGR